MRIPIILTTNIIWFIGIINSKSTPEKIAGNQAEKGENVNQYITIDISSTSPVNTFYFLNSQINGVNTVIFFPNSKKKVKQVRDNNTVFWDREQNEQFIIGFISKNVESQDHIIHLMINTQKGIEKLYYQYINGKYSQIDIFRYLDIFTSLKPILDRVPFTLDLSKDKIPEILDKGAILGINKASLFIPKAGYKANKVVFGALNVYDGSHIEMEISIAIAYEIQGISYLDLMLVKEGQNIGHIHSYQFIAEGDTRLISTSEPVSIFDIFVARVSPKDINHPIVHPRVREIKRQSAYNYDIIREINLDIKNVDKSVIHTDDFKVLNIRTTKYLPIGVIIKSVSYGKKQLWKSNEDEIRCKNVITHSVSDVMQSIEITILENTGKTSSKIIPLQKIIEGESETHESNSDGINMVVKDGKWDFDHHPDFEKEGHEGQLTGISTPPNSPEGPYEPLDDEELRSIFSGELMSIYQDDSKSTPPNSPARTEPNSSASTPPPSPMSTRVNSIYSKRRYTGENGVQEEMPYYNRDIEDLLNDEITIPDIADGEDKVDYMARYNPFAPIDPPKGFDDLYIDRESDSEDTESTTDSGSMIDIDSMDDIMFDLDYINAMHQQDFYYDQYGKKYYYSQYKDSLVDIDEDMILDIASEESKSKLYVIDGRKYMPFIFLMPHFNQKIKSVVDGSQVIWDGGDLGQLLKYATLYLYKEEVKGMYLMISQELAIVNKYYFKKGDKWIEITFEEYMNNTKYKVKKQTKKQKDHKKDEKINQDQKNEQKQDDSKERVLHVSIIVPVILGSLFLIVSVGALLFMVFFC